MPCTRRSLRSNHAGVNPITFLCFVSSGVLFYYILLQMNLWWLFHVFMFFWKVTFPFHARSYERANRMKYVHIVMISIALTVPVIPVIATVVDGGYGLTRFPPIFCTGTSPTATFYSLILPITLSTQCGVTMLIIIFWVIHKVRIMQHTW